MAINLQEIFTYPYDNDLLLRKQKRIRRELLAREGVSYADKRIAILGGSTTNDMVHILELHLLATGIRPVFFQSEYNKYYEDAVFGNADLDVFQPEVIIIYTSVVNLINRPDQDDDADAVSGKLEAEYSRYQQVWQALQQRYSAVIIQNNFELPPAEPLGSLGASANFGVTHFVRDLNRRFAEYAAATDGFYLHDLCGLSARVGLSRWFDENQFFAYKYAASYDVMPEIANSLAKLIRAIYGKNRKCLVLDLDNTLWGGIIGDDGVENLQIGHETPLAEAFTAFQQYVKALKQRGVILAVCSKNEEDIAKSGFSHPDSVLQVDDFIAFHANWEPKSINIRQIAQEINIGTDSLVFIDDNPAERQIVRDALPEVAVPEVNPDDVFSYIRAIEGAGYFEPASITNDDRKRNATYQQNKQRNELANAVGNYDDFLQSLSMQAEIASFQPVYFDRIAQLTNKSNQFNLTTERYTRADIERMSDDSAFITLYGRLADKFGDNGLISVVIGEKEGELLHIRLWLMSCRVLKRGMEQVMLDELVHKARKAGCTELVGYYFPTRKNKMVAGLYESFGFTKVSEEEGNTIWRLNLADYKTLGKYIEVKRGL